jgi:hypothetical protein
MEQKYLDMLIAVDKGIKEYAAATLYWREPLNIPPPQHTTGWRINDGLERNDFFERIDWLAANGYITIGAGPHDGEWCDITQSYVETYTLTKLGKEMVGRR